MELVEGRSLSEELQKTPTPPVARVIRYGKELAEALEVAHAKGILHRDVNPNNILITTEGRARLMDFGLAKLFVAPGQFSSATTQSQPLTQEGRVVGTPGYMSPEQILGKAVDPRSDIFSLGSVLYRMCTGKEAFHSTNQGALLDAVLHREPEPISKLNYEVPEELERIIRKSLAKSPDERYQHVGDLKADLHALHRFLDHQSYQEQHPESSPTGSAQHPRRLPRKLVRGLGWAAAGVLVASLGWFAWQRWEDPPAEPALQIAALVTWPSEEMDGRLSPDRQWFSFVSDRNGRHQIWVRRLSGGEPRVITAAEGTITSHVWSPDGNDIAYLLRSFEGMRLQVVSAPLGGRPRVNLEIGESYRRLVRWLGSRIYLESESRSLWRLALTTMTFEEITTEPWGFDLRTAMDIDTSEKRVVFAGTRDGAEDVWTATLDGREITNLTRDRFRAQTPRWFGVRNEKVLYLANATGPIDLWELDLEKGSRKQVPFGHEIHAIDDVSQDGSLAILQVMEENADVWWLDPSTTEAKQLTADTLKDFHPTGALATERVAFQRSKPGQSLGFAYVASQIWLADWRSGRLADEHLLVADGFAPLLSPDGNRIAYLRWSSRPPCVAELWVTEVDTRRSGRLSDCYGFGGLSATAQTPLELTARNVVWHHNGSVVFFVHRSEAGVREVRRTDLMNGSFESEVLVSALRKTIQNLEISQDASRLAYLLSYPEPGGKVSTWEIHEMDLVTGEDGILHTESQPYGTVMHLRGWSMEPGSLILLRARMNPEFSQHIEVLSIDGTGQVQVLGAAERAFSLTAMLDASTGALYLTMVQDKVHNIFEYSTISHDFRKITDNQLPGVTFSGIEVLDDGTLVYSRHQRNRNLWLLNVER